MRLRRGLGVIGVKCFQGVHGEGQLLSAGVGISATGCTLTESVLPAVNGPVYGRRGRHGV